MKYINKIIACLLFVTVIPSILCLHIADATQNVYWLFVGHTSIVTATIAAGAQSIALWNILCIVLIGITIVCAVAIIKNVIWISIVCAAGYFIDICYAIYSNAFKYRIPFYFSYIADGIMLILFTLYFIGIFKEKKSSKKQIATSKSILE
jgi:membrane protein